MSAALTLSTRRAGAGHVEMTAAGELDLSNIGRFEDALRAAIADAGDDGTTSLDLAGVEYLDSAAINVLFTHAGKISRVVVHPLVLRGLTISGLDQVVSVQPAAR